MSPASEWRRFSTEHPMDYAHILKELEEIYICVEHEVKFLCKLYAAISICLVQTCTVLEVKVLLSLY